MLTSLALLFASLSSPTSFRIDPSAELQKRAAAFNQDFFKAHPETRVENELRPFADYEGVRYVLLSQLSTSSSSSLKRDLVAKIPPEVTVVILVTDARYSEWFRKNWGPLRPEGKLKFLFADNANSNGAFWARDSLPIPLVGTSDSKLSLVQAKNWAGFEAGDIVAKYFSTSVQRMPFYFEGGNFHADTERNCFIVDNATAARIPESTFVSQYGCRKLVRFPWRAGIGHVDEHVMILDKRIALTDLPEYQTTLEHLGYRVTLLPRAYGYRTYLNSLAVNDTIFVPTFGTVDDATAIKEYAALGFKVAPMNTQLLSDNGHGSIHCITMAYPAGTFVSDPARDGFLQFR